MYPEKMNYDQFQILDDGKHYTGLLVIKKSELQQYFAQKQIWLNMVNRIVNILLV